MTIPPPDRSRDRRIEDPSNLWIIHPAGRGLLPWFVARGISANAVSVCGLALGIGAAYAYSNWTDWRWALVGLLLSVGWLIADGLDGMIARATGTASALGRFLDGLCDHGVFILIYVVLATSIGTVEGWALAISAGVAHAVQSSIYEGERARFHRRCKGDAGTPPVPSRNPLVRLYDSVATAADRFARAFDDSLRRQSDPAAFGAAYGEAAVGPMGLMRLLSANMRVFAIFLACLVGNPRYFWWFELVPLTVILVIGLFWHRAVEARFAGATPVSTPSHTQRT
jgi:CDP-diacylglycerol---serine O-phosphatidyltransferase